MRSFAGMVGLLALIAAIVVGTLAVVGILSDAPTASGVGGSEVRIEEKAVRERATEIIGESVDAGDLFWTITDARRVAELHSYTYPPSTLRGDFLTITFTVENTSDGSVTLTEESMALVDEETGLQDLPAASVNAEYVDPIKSVLFNEEGLLDPGEEVEGEVNFDLSIPFGQNPTTDLSGFRLEFGDADPTVEEEKRLDLGL